MMPDSYGASLRLWGLVGPRTKLRVTNAPISPSTIRTKRMRVLGIKVGIIDQPDSKIVTEIPREQLRAKPARRVMLYRAVDLTDPQGNKVTRMKFSLFDGADATKFAQLLGEPPAARVA